MAVYLDECQAGRDKAVIGFPHILLCMAVVVQTKSWLFGMHFDSPGDSQELADALKDFIKRKGGTMDDAVRLYGCCHHKKRNGQRKPEPKDADQAWKDEMKMIAGRLGYSGTVTGFDTSIITPKNGTYVEFDRSKGGDKCTVYYKRHEKMSHDVSFIRLKDRGTAGDGDVNTWQVSAPKYGRVAQWIPNKSVTTSATLAPKATTMHELNYFLRATSFNV